MLDSGTPAPEQSIFQGNLPLATKLERARTELLDLSARNRLLHTPRFSKTAKTVDVVDERATEVFRLLVREGKTFTFTPGRPDRDPGVAGQEELGEEDVSNADLAQPEEIDALEQRIEPRHFDTKLHTRMTPKGLQKRLLDLYHDARTLEEEQGVNILFLAIGTLNWTDPIKKELTRYAPLILIPVSLERGTAGEKFRLRLRPEDLLGNLSLEAYLEKVHTLRLPAFDGGEEFEPATYLAAVAQAVSTKPEWSVTADNIVLGFFSFAKFLMYRDLDPANWPADARLTEHPTIRALLADGFASPEPSISDDAPIDPHIGPEELLHIVDCDSSQTLAVHDVRQGRDLVIQGPPGTGKSQTIANAIAAAVADGKTVLFVAEKMAALEVVKRRLDHAGVGDACLELHSNKSNKRAVLEELRRTWELGAPRGEVDPALIPNLTAARDRLNDHALAMHTPHATSQLTPYAVFGHLTRLRQSGTAPSEFRLIDAPAWTPDGFRTRSAMLRELVQRLQEMGLPAQHPWNGVGLSSILPTQLDRLVPQLAELLQQVLRLQADITQLAARLELDDAPRTFKDVRRIRVKAEMVGHAPALTPEALASDVWANNLDALRELTLQGLAFAQMERELHSQLTPNALQTDVTELTETLGRLPPDLTAEGFGQARALVDLLPQLERSASRLSRELGSVGLLGTLADVARLIATAERVSVAPDASPDAFAATVWDHGVEQAGDLVDAVKVLEETRKRIGERVLDVAWTTDVRAARQSLATQTGILRFLSSNWRKASAMARSIVRDPSLPVADLVSLLDLLMRGQAAAAKVKEGDAFGRSAFGADWRGERSNSVPLQALVAWMRTLRGLGAEPRLIASKIVQRTSLGERAAQTRELLVKTQAVWRDLWLVLGATVSERLNGAASAEGAPLPQVQQLCEAMVSADELLHAVMSPVPNHVQQRLELARRLLEWQVLGNSIRSHDALAAKAFDQAWQGLSSDWAVLSEGVEWIAGHSDQRMLAARLPDRGTLMLQAQQTHARSESLSHVFSDLTTKLQSDPKALFNVQDLALLPLDLAASKLSGWIDNAEQLSTWVAYVERARKAHEAGLGKIVDALGSGILPLSSAWDTFELAYYEAVLAELVAQNPELGRFDGVLHARHVQEFARLDWQRIKSACLQAVLAHHRRIPSRDGGMGPVGILRTEMAKRRGHMPIRQLMHKAGAAVQALKPVMMMSPLSVAQFLTPGGMNFDLLVMDEASQIQPVDALGAIARCKQVVVVGDERQLPPTKFFAKMTGSEAREDDDDDAPVADIESILGLFTARGLPQRMLRWHYRSRHQSLIAISNREFYESKLFVVPSPYTQEAGMGLSFHHVANGVFDSGGTGANAVEAKTVAQAVIRHAKAHPLQSLGVAAFSVSQRRAIQDEVEALRRLNPDTEDFFHSHPSEPFFVKNLENVQGDERDVIMISVGYARNAQGYMAMRFGPLGADGGERRLNVLISRAKRRCEVFASITDDDIDLGRAKGKGVVAFKLFLHYARTGRLSIAQASGRDMESVFEEQVASALQARGYQVHPQVGLAGFFIDLAIADAERPGRYLLGIECDGANYHSSRSARDRDRLRQAVLEDHGWSLHRIWSTDWFQRPQEQLERAVSAIEEARRESDARSKAGETSRRGVAVEIVTVDRGDASEISLSTSLAPVGDGTPYREASVTRPGPYELHETPMGVMADLVDQVVKVESPVHVDEVIARMKAAWGLQRAGARIEAAVKQGVTLAASRGLVSHSGPFLSNPGAPLIIRDRGGAASPGVRKIEMIAPQEIAIGVNQVVAANLGGTQDEVETAVSRLLGFKSTSAQLRRTIGTIVDEMLRDGKLRREGALVVPVDKDSL